MGGCCGRSGYSDPANLEEFKTSRLLSPVGGEVEKIQEDRVYIRATVGRMCAPCAGLFGAKARDSHPQQMIASIEDVQFGADEYPMFLVGNGYTVHQGQHIAAIDDCQVWLAIPSDFCVVVRVGDVLLVGKTVVAYLKQG